ncbi:MAG: ATP-binding protein [Candidatus Delongbacteria bacterium]|nr:ATP-binding protein [Candidatus Delongbacteria bacterium]
MKIDLRTIALILLIMHVVQIFVFTHLYVTNRTLREIKWWLLWSVFGVFSYLMIVVRNMLGEHPAVVIIQNTAMVSAAVFIYIGVIRFYGSKENRKILLGALSLYVALMIVFAAVFINVRVHTTITNVYLSVFAVITALVLIRNKPAAKSSALLVIYYVFLFHGLVFMLRASFVATGIMDRQNFFNPDPLNILTFIDGIVTSVLWTFGFVVLINQRVNEKIKETLDQFELIFNTSPDAATITNMRNGLIINVNDHFGIVTGYTKKEAMGTTVIDLWKEPEKRKEFIKILTDSGGIENYETEFMHKTGRVINGLVSAKILKLGSVPHILAITRDITKLKENEKERERLKIELSQSQKLQSIGTLAAGIAHEINSPLQFTNDNIDFIANSYQDIINLVNTYKNLMMSCHTDQDKENARNTIFDLEKKINLDFLTREMPEALSQTKDGIARIRKIVNAMKQYSNLNLQEKKAADINKTFENAEIITRNEWKYHAEVINEFDPELPFCECFEAELNQVFMNLIVNAAHATKDAVDQKFIEKGIITIKTSHNEGKILISISDNGTGIPDKIKDKIYDPFFTTKEVGKGTGQGLAIAHKAVVDRHGGKIWFETEQNKGTTFYIEVQV